MPPRIGFPSAVHLGKGGEECTNDDLQVFLGELVKGNPLGRHPAPREAAVEVLEMLQGIQTRGPVPRGMKQGAHDQVVPMTRRGGGEGELVRNDPWAEPAHGRTPTAGAYLSIVYRH